MRYVQAGFVGEGPTDAQFLAPLTRRLLEAHLLTKARSDVLVPDPVVVKPGQGWGNRPASVINELRSEFSYLHLLLYHTDSAGSVPDAYAERVDVVREGCSVPVVGVVPRREMEAWALADPAALCDVLGVNPSRVNIPAEFSPKRVESITDPKAALSMFVDAIPGRHFVSPDPEVNLFGALALSIDLDVLCQVPQARRLADDLEAVALCQGWLL